MSSPWEGLRGLSWRIVTAVSRGRSALLRLRDDDTAGAVACVAAPPRPPATRPPRKGDATSASRALRASRRTTANGDVRLGGDASGGAGARAVTGGVLGLVGVTWYTFDANVISPTGMPVRAEGSSCAIIVGGMKE